MFSFCAGSAAVVVDDSDEAVDVNVVIRRRGC